LNIFYLCLIDALEIVLTNIYSDITHVNGQMVGFKKFHGENWAQVATKSKQIMSIFVHREPNILSIDTLINLENNVLVVKTGGTLCIQTNKKAYLN